MIVIVLSLSSSGKTDGSWTGRSLLLTHADVTFGTGSFCWSKLVQAGPPIALPTETPTLQMMKIKAVSRKGSLRMRQPKRQSVVTLTDSGI
jgi:hypothetical protein